MGVIVSLTKKRAARTQTDSPRLDNDRTLQRELRRARALRSVGWLNGTCEACRTMLWLRAGEEDLEDPRRNLSAEIVAAVAAETAVVGRLSAKLAARRLLSAPERDRLGLAISRIEAAQGLLRDAR